MRRNKVILGLSLVAIFATTSCGSKGFKHTKSSENYVYFADLDHNGEIKDNEKNLTWEQSYNALLSGANKMSTLKAFCAPEKFNINTQDPKYGSLARYEIMHQAEELVMHTQAITPLYDYADPFLLKPDIVDIYECDLGYKFLDQLKWKNGSGKKRDFTMCFGTKADTFDPGVNTDASTANVLSQIYTGAKRWQKTDIDYDPTGRGKKGAYLAELGDGVCDVKKRIVTKTKELAENDSENYVWFGDCPDLTGGESDPAKYLENPDDYEGTARYEITIKENAKWNKVKGNETIDELKITPDDFIYAWTRASSAIYNNVPLGMWCSLFDMIRGYDVWNMVGQQEHPEKWQVFDPNKDYSPMTSQDSDPDQTINTIIKSEDSDDLTEVKYAVVNMEYKGGMATDWESAMKLVNDSKNPYFTEITNTDAEGEIIDNKKIQRWRQNFDGIDGEIEPSGAKGGMAGVMKGRPEEPANVNNNQTFTVQLVNDSEYFEELLAFPAFMPVKKSEIIVIPSNADELKNVCNEKPSWYLNKGGDDGYHYTDGSLKIKGEIDNNDGGKIELTKGDNAGSETIDNLTLKFIDKDGAAFDSYNSGAVQMIDAVASGIIDKVKKTDDWRIAPQIGLFYFIFNVNDNTFDLVPESADKAESERTREKLREIMNLLVNRNDLCQNIVKTGAKSSNGVVTTGITERCVPVMAKVDGVQKGYVALRGWKDENDVVTSVNPKFSNQNDLDKYLAGNYETQGHKVDTLVTRDWHDSNIDNFEHWIDDKDYKNYWLDKRYKNTQTAKEEYKDGFYSTVTVDTTTKEGEDIEKDSMSINLARVEAIAKDLENGALKGTGFKYVPSTNPQEDKYGHFENFPSVALATNTGTGIEDICERMQAYYSLWGIDMSIQTQEWQSYTATRRAGDYAYARHGWVADYNDPRTYLDTFRAGDGNNDTQLGKNSWHDSK